MAVPKGVGYAPLEDKAPKLLRHGPGLLPSYSILILPASGPLACAYGGQDERRMFCEQQDEPLAHGARCTQDSTPFGGQCGFLG